jgi:hypothetical protein
MKLIDLLNEEIDDFQVGDEKTIGGKSHKITDIDPETKSITWDIKKRLNDGDIHNELTKLINFLTDRKDEYHDPKRLKELITKFKFIRNTFKRSSI